MSNRLDQMTLMISIGILCTLCPAGAMAAEAAENETHPRWSPDGTRIAFLSTKGGERALVIASASDESRRVVVKDAKLNDNFRWLPNGEQLVFSTGRSAKAELHVIEVESGRVETLGPGSQPAPGPRGAKLAALTDRDVLVYDLATGERRNLTQRERRAMLKGVCWSVDGDRLFVARDGDLWVVEVRSGDATKLVDHSARGATAPLITGPRQGTGGRLIYFALETEGLYNGATANRLGVYDIQMRTDREIMEADHFSISPNGAYAVCAVGVELFYWLFDDGRRVGMGRGRHPAISPDGKHVAFAYSEKVLGPQRIVVRSIEALVEDVESLGNARGW